MMYLLIILIPASVLYAFKTGRLKLHICKNINRSEYSSLFLMALIFHVVFAFLSSGNAEFMVMLPFLLVFYMAGAYQGRAGKILPLLTVTLFIWNMGAAILPARFLDLNRVDRQVRFTLEHPDNYVLWKYKPLIENIITYEKGFAMHPKFLKTQQHLLDSLVEHQIPVYSDYGNPGTDFSREAIVRGNSSISGRYIFLPQLSWENIYGKNEINLISKKGD